MHIEELIVFTLLYCILLISSEDWGSPGNRCLSRSKIVSALSSNSSLFSKLIAEPQEDFESLWCIFLFQITMEASILFFRSRTLCSVDKSMLARKSSGSKNSTVMLLYIDSPRLDLPFYQVTEVEKMSQIWVLALWNNMILKKQGREVVHKIISSLVPLMMRNCVLQMLFSVPGALHPNVLRSCPFM